MPKEFWIIAVSGSVVVAAIALFLGRRFRFKSGQTEWEANQPAGGVNQSVTASGPGSSVKRAVQESIGAENGAQNIAADKSGTIEDVEQKKGK